jgi:hypothetical protein
MNESHCVSEIEPPGCGMALWGWSSSGVKAFALAHKILFIDHDLVEIIHGPIQDDVGDGAFMDLLVPAGWSELWDEDRRAHLMACFDELE